jgi:hypothetical protein
MIDRESMRRGSPRRAPPRGALAQPAARAPRCARPLHGGAAHLPVCAPNGASPGISRALLLRRYTCQGLGNHAGTTRVQHSDLWPHPGRPRGAELVLGSRRAGAHPRVAGGNRRSATLHDLEPRRRSWVPPRLPPDHADRVLEAAKQGHTQTPKDAHPRRQLVRVPRGAWGMQPAAGASKMARSDPASDRGASAGGSASRVPVSAPVTDYEKLHRIGEGTYGVVCEHPGTSWQAGRRGAGGSQVVGAAAIIIDAWGMRRCIAACRQGPAHPHRRHRGAEESAL